MAEKEKKELDQRCFDNAVHEDEGLEWYFNWYVIALAIILLGPLGLLPLWFRPDTGRRAKIVITVLVAVVTLFMAYGSADFYRRSIFRFEQDMRAVE